MKWFSLTNKCDVCKLQGNSVLVFRTGDKRVNMCSMEWNTLMAGVFADDPETLEKTLVLPESCECVKGQES